MERADDIDQSNSVNTENTLDIPEEHGVGDHTSMIQMSGKGDPAGVAKGVGENSEDSNANTDNKVVNGMGTLQYVQEALDSRPEMCVDEEQLSVEVKMLMERDGYDFDLETVRALVDFALPYGEKMGKLRLVNQEAPEAVTPNVNPIKHVVKRQVSQPTKSHCTAKRRRVAKPRHRVDKPQHRVAKPRNRVAKPSRLDIPEENGVDDASMIQMSGKGDPVGVAKGVGENSEDSNANTDNKVVNGMGTLQYVQEALDSHPEMCVDEEQLSVEVKMLMERDGYDFDLETVRALVDFALPYGEKMGKFRLVNQEAPEAVTPNVNPIKHVVKRQVSKPTKSNRTAKRRREAKPHRRVAKPRHRVAKPHHRGAMPRHREAKPRRRVAKPRNRVAKPRRVAKRRNRVAKPRNRVAKPRRVAKRQHVAKRYTWK